MSNARQRDNFIIYSLSQAFPNRRISKVLCDETCLLSLALAILGRAISQNQYEGGEELNEANRRLSLSHEKLHRLLVKQLGSGSFAIANLQSTLKQAKAIEHANGEMQTILNLERLSGSIASANVLGDLFEVLRLLSLAYERLLDALDEELRLRKGGQQNTGEVSLLKKKGLEYALIEELRLALLD